MVQRTSAVGQSVYMFFSFRLFAALSFRAKTRNPGSVSIRACPFNTIVWSPLGSAYPKLHGSNHVQRRSVGESEDENYKFANFILISSNYWRPIVKLSSCRGRHATFFHQPIPSTGFFILLTIWRQCVMLEEKWSGWKAAQIHEKVKTTKSILGYYANKSGKTR